MLRGQALIRQGVADRSIYHSTSVGLQYTFLVIASGDSSKPCAAQYILLSLPWVLGAIRKHPARCIIVFFGVGFPLLAVVEAIQRFTCIPVDAYLVDDLEAFADLNGNSYAKGLIRRWEAHVLGQCSKVWAISVRYCDHLDRK